MILTEAISTCVFHKLSVYYAVYNNEKASCITVADTFTINTQWNSKIYSMFDFRALYVGSSGEKWCRSIHFTS